ncbi:ArdC-like ssDNA-binding domain-containing protein [Micromonospora sp.]|uniref:ArdC-like ssDNA-binding domain-containing protein n=1 Tax=Micromonospora sp. TaxID=1876 RepID=UPI003B39FD89
MATSRRKSSPAELERRRQAAADKLVAAHDRIVDGVRELITGEDWARYLRFAARFHNYSFNNTISILKQAPDATYVAGYETWKSVGRQVRKGERGITILAPVMARRTPEDAAQPTAQALAEPAGESSEPGRRMVGVRTASVFDVRQTDPIVPGEELPLVRPIELTGAAPAELWSGLARQIQGCGFTIERSDCGGANGRTQWAERIVRVRDDVAELQAVKTLAHELGHVVLHDPVDQASGRPDCRGTVEVEAESFAALVLGSQGITTDDYSFPYVASWAAQGNDPDAAIQVVRDTANRVIKAAHQVIERLNPETTTVDTDALLERAQHAAAAAVHTSEPAAAPATPAAVTVAPEPVFTTADLHRINMTATQWFQDFGRAELAARYLADRGVRAIADGYTVGYGPVGGGIAAWLHMRGISNEAAIAAGLARVAGDGQIRDVFRDRVIVAIRDGQHIAGYAGRALRDDVEPRWLNTRATDAFDKSRLLLGLSEGAERLAAGCTPVLVEGPVDALAIGQYGGDVVPVAVTGTAFTAAHIEALAAAVPADRRRIIVAMDDDEAGRRAAVDAGIALVNAGWLVRTPRDGHGMDPAQIADLHGQKVLDWLDARRCRSVHHLAAEVYVRSHRDLRTIEGRVHAATTTARLLDERFPPSTETTAAVRLAYDLAGVTPPTSVALGLPTPPRLSSAARTDRERSPNYLVPAGLER